MDRRTMADTRPHYFLKEWITPTDEHLNVDVCIYGGTAGGVVAAVKAARLGKSVVLLQPGKFLGGMTTGGLGWTDFGRKFVIGGMSRNFYERVGKLYGLKEEWQFEPSKASTVIQQLIDEANVPVRFCEYIDSIEKDGASIKSITMLSGLKVTAKVFVDASYEGDLMASAGVSFHVGRESNRVYGEELNGIQPRNQHQFSHPIDPFVKIGDPSSGLLPHIENIDMYEKRGEGDDRVQAYNFRMCMTDDPALKIDWEEPDDFNEIEYELARRWFNSEKDSYNEQVCHSATPAWHIHKDVPVKFDILPNKTPGGFHKTDTNNHGPVSSDYIGANWQWPHATYEQREAIFQAHVTYQKGLYWFIANDESIPEKYRTAYSRWGLPKDEFVETGHWPHQLYIRECRRMVSDYVITEHDCRATKVAEDSVGMGSYTMDSHNCTRFVHDGDDGPQVLNEGDVQVPPTDPYPVSYHAIVPKQAECDNLFVPTCFSASHIAYGSARMEPVFMVLGESTAIAACMAIDDGGAVQQVDYAKLRGKLIDAGQVLDLSMRID